MLLSTGFVIASGYADKVRRALFAATRGQVPKEEVVKAAAELNRYLYDELRKRGVDKLDVVRIRVPFEVKDGRIMWDYENIEIQVYKAADEEALSSAMREVQEDTEVLKMKLDALKDKLGKIEELITGIETAPLSDLEDLLSSLKKEIKSAKELLETTTEEHA